MTLTRADLRPYQTRAVDWIKSHEHCALWLDMGLGKTTSTLTAYADMLETFDARRRFALPDRPAAEAPGCCCGEILRGIREPSECPLFGRRCTPARPVGPCMVSSEGTCAARYRYG